MEAPAATIDIDRSGRHLTVYVSGELDGHTAPELAEQIIDRVADDDEVVWLDLSSVTFCGSAGVGLLVRVSEHVELVGGRCTLYDPAPCVRRVLEVCRLDRAFATWTG